MVCGRCAEAHIAFRHDRVSDAEQRARPMFGVDDPNHLHGTMMIAVRAARIAFAITFAALTAASNGATCQDFASAVNYGAGAAPRWIAAADLNHDGKLDLVTANQNSKNVSVFIGNGDGTFAAAVNYAVGDTPLSVAIADVNGDGKA